MIAEKEWKFKKKLLRITVSAVVILSIGALTPGASAAGDKMLVPMGNAVGINMLTDGVVVVGLTDIETDCGTVSPAKDAGIAAGDVITKLAGKEIDSSADLTDTLGNLDGKNPVQVQVERGEKCVQLEILPYKPADGPCELGLWLRDGMTGIGTMTFYDPETQTFGALGHSITDSESGALLPLRDGTIMRANVTDIVPGQSGTPGQIIGSFDEAGKIGTLNMNSHFGVFGKMEQNSLTCGDAMPAAPESEISTGKAIIRTNISGSNVEEYEVEITRVYSGDGEDRTMMLRVTDPELISLTGGIVQGMSGSPIIQNGKIIGAVTHVLIGDPEKGYGISIEKMLDKAESIANAPAA